MFWKRGWNVLDFFIVVALLLGPCEFIVDMRFLIFTCKLLFFHLLIFLLVQIKFALLNKWREKGTGSHHKTC